MTARDYSAMTALARDLVEHADRREWRRNVAQAARAALRAGTDRANVRRFCRQMRDPWTAFSIVEASR